MPDEAVNARQRERRARYPRVRAYDLRYAAARNEAIRQLIARHQRDYRQLLAAEVRKVRGANIDPVAVDRLVAGDRPEKTTAAERREAVRILHARGLSDKQVAERVGLQPRNVQRHLAILAGRG